MNLPFAFATIDEIDKTFKDPEFVKALGAEYEKAGFHLLGISNLGFRITTANKAIMTPEDLKGLTIRTMENKNHIEMWRKLGANPTPLAFNELYTALQQGTVDGQENPMELIYTQKYFEQQTDISKTNHIPHCLCWVMNLAQYDSLTDEQKKQIAALDELYRDWNNKINVISRKDIDNLYEHHVLHSMAIAKAINFRPGTEILDFGCGGGFPGIPLAILFPECQFKLIDGTGKKIRVCNEVASAIGLKNLVAEHLRGEDEKGKYDFVVSRAVMQLPDLMKIIKKNFKKKGQNALPNGLICLKGGNLQEELKDYRNVAEITPLSTFFEEEWFKQDKQLIYVPA